MLAVVYLTVGLLATAAMIDIALSRGVDAKRLTIASNLATEMLDRMRFNSPGNAAAIGVLYPGVPFSYHGMIVCSDPANLYDSRSQLSCHICWYLHRTCVGKCCCSALVNGSLIFRF